MTPKPRSLWSRDFTAFWIGKTISEFGTQVTFVALPLLAVITLHASVGELGILRFAEYLPFLLLTPFFGVWADRSRRWPLMLGSYAVRAVLVISVPLLIAFGLLRMPVLVVIMFGIGAGAALFEVCWLSYVPGLVTQQRMIQAMSKCQMSQSAAEISGTGLGGVLVQVLTAPVTLVVDGLSYLVGIASLARIRYREPEPVRPEDGPRHVGHEILEGLRFAFAQPYIRPTALMAASGNFFALITETAFLFAAVRVLELSPGLVGLVLTVAGAGCLVGASLATTVTRRWPLGSVFVVSRLVCGAGAIVLPLAAGPSTVVVIISAASFFIVQLGMATSNVLTASLRQAVTPAPMRGRMNASCRVLVYGALPLGSLAGGILGETVGLHATLWLGAIGYACSIIPLLLSPIPRLVRLPLSPGAEELSGQRHE